MQLQPSGAQAAFYELASDEQLDWVPPTTEWTVENADVHISVMATLNTRELPRLTRRSRRAPEGAQADHGDLDAASRDGRATAGRSRCSRRTHFASEAGMSLSATRTSTTRPASPSTAIQ